MKVYEDPSWIYDRSYLSSREKSAKSTNRVKN